MNTRYELQTESVSTHIISCLLKLKLQLLFEINQEETKYCYHVQIKVPRLTYVLNVDLTLMFNFCGDIWGWGERRGMKNGEREEIREGRGKGQSQPAVTTFDCSVNASLQLELRPGAYL